MPFIIAMHWSRKQIYRIFAPLPWIKQEDVPRWSVQLTTSRFDNFEFKANTTMGLTSRQRIQIRKGCTTKPNSSASLLTPLADEANWSWAERELYWDWIGGSNINTNQEASVCHKIPDNIVLKMGKGGYSVRADKSSRLLRFASTMPRCLGIIRMFRL